MEFKKELNKLFDTMEQNIVDNTNLSLDQLGLEGLEACKNLEKTMTLMNLSKEMINSFIDFEEAKMERLESIERKIDNLSK